MARNLTTKILFNGVDNVSRVLAGIQRNVSGAGKSISNFGRGMGMNGFLTSGMISAPLAALGRDTANTFADYEDQVTRTAAVTRKQGEDIKGVYDELSKAANEVAVSTPFSALEVAAAQFSAATAGLEKSEIINLMPKFADGATVMGTSIEYAADQLNASVSAFSGPLPIDQKMQQIQKLNDLLSYTALNSAGSTEEIVQSFRRFGPVAQLFAADMEESFAMIGALADAGIRGQQAGRALRTIGLRLAAPSNKAMAEFDKMGVDPLQFRSGPTRAVNANDITGALRGSGISESVDINRLVEQANENIDPDLKLDRMISALQDQLGEIEPEAEAKVRDFLSKSLAGASGNVDYMKAMGVLAEKFKAGKLNDTAINEIFGKERADAAVNLLKQWDKIQETINASRTGASGSVERLTEDFRGTLKRIMETLGGAFESAQIRIFQSVAGDLKVALKVATDILDRIGDFAEANPAIARMIVLFTVLAATLGPAMIYFGLAANGVGALVRSLGLLLLPAVAASRVLSLLAAAVLRFGPRTGKLATAAMLRMSPVLLGLSVAGLVAYKSFGKLQEIFGKIGEMKEFQQGMTFARAALTNFFAGDMQSARNLFGLAMGRFKAVAIKVWGEVGGVLRASWNQIIADLDKVFPSFAGLRQAFSSLVSEIGAFFDAVSPGASSGGIAFLSELADVARRIGDGAVLAAAGTLNALTDSIRGIRAALTGENLNLGGFGEFFKKLTEGVQAGVAAFAQGGGILSFTDLFSGLGEAFAKLGGSIQNLMSIFQGGGGGNIGAAFKIIGEALGGLARFATDTALITVTAIIEKLANWINTLANTIRALSTGDFMGAFRALWTGLAEDLRISVEAIDKLIAALGFDFKLSDSLMSAFDWLKEKADSLFGVLSKIRDFFTWAGASTGNALPPEVAQPRTGGINFGVPGVAGSTPRQIMKVGEANWGNAFNGNPAGDARALQQFLSDTFAKDSPARQQAINGFMQSLSQSASKIADSINSLSAPSIKVGDANWGNALSGDPAGAIQTMATALQTAWKVIKYTSPEQRRAEAADAKFPGKAKDDLDLGSLKTSTDRTASSVEALRTEMADQMSGLKSTMDSSHGTLQSINNGISQIPPAIRAGLSWANQRSDGTPPGGVPRVQVNSNGVSGVR